MNAVAKDPSRFARRRALRLMPCALAVALALGAVGSAQALPQSRSNLGQGLRQLVQMHEAALAAGRGTGSAQLRADAAKTLASGAIFDTRDRVRVQLHLDGSVPLAAFKTSAAWTGLQVVAESASYRQGVMTAFVPLSQVSSVARLPGVRSMHLSRAPRTNVGATTSQGVAVLKSDQVNALGYQGAGITVAALSDSYDAAADLLTNAAQDVASGDLPGPGNPNGDIAPVVVLQEIADPTQGLDEGRAMLQIVHDVAPKSQLCFASAFNGEVQFANNIIALADPKGACRANVIVDDAFYVTEPFFSDGLVAQAVDQVAAQGVHYFSSAGNQGNSGGYDSEFRPVSLSDAQASNPSVNLALLPAGAAAGGLHNFSTVPGVIDVTQTVTVGGPGSLILQWNDPFDANAVSTDYDIYLFNADGSALDLANSGVDQNTGPNGTDEPIEGLFFPTAGTYQLVLARHTADNASPPPLAKRFRYVNFAGAIGGEYLSLSSPVTFGHNSARGATGTAAVPWFESYLPEYFSSPGPVTIYFDAQGKRLARPETRQKPDISAPDGGNTTFFYPNDDSAEDPDAFFNFFGTSAAAPHAAGVAALLLQKAGGPTGLSPDQLRTVLQQTAGAHNLQAGHVAASAKVGPARLSVTAVDNPLLIAADPNTFTVSLSAPAGFYLKNLSINIATANAQRVRLSVPQPGLQFDPTSSTGYPVTLGTLKNISAADVRTSPLRQSAPFSQTLTLSFTNGAFANGTSLSFGVDRDEVATGAGGNAVDLLAGATLSGVIVGPRRTSTPFTTTLQPKRFGKGYSPLDGYGLIDALGALNAVPAAGTRH